MEATEIQTGDQRLELRLTTAKAPPRRRSVRQHIAEVAQFLAVVAQFGLVVLLVQYWQLESQLLARVMWLAFAGFIIHHLLPLRFRLPFFAMLSLVAVITAVGHFGPNVIASWMTGKITLNGLLYHLVPGLTLGRDWLRLDWAMSSADSLWRARWAGGSRRRWARLLAGA